MKMCNPEHPETLKVLAPLGTSLTEKGEGQRSGAQECDRSKATQMPPQQLGWEWWGKATGQEASLARHWAA